MENKKIISTKKWTIEVNEYSDGSSDLVRTNEGFDALELLGLADLASWDIREMIVGRIKVDAIKRQVIED